MVKPRILNGMSMIQAMIKRKNSTMASGQHRTKSIHHNNNAIRVFIKRFLPKHKAISAPQL